jgi:hypothetical protein
MTENNGTCGGTWRSNCGAAADDAAAAEQYEVWRTHTSPVTFTPVKTQISVSTGGMGGKFYRGTFERATQRADELRSRYPHNAYEVVRSEDTGPESPSEY